MREEFLVQRAHDVHARFRFGELGRDQDRTHALAPVEPGHAWAEFPRSHRRERDFAAIRCAHTERRKALQRAPGVTRITNVDAHFIAVARQTLHFLAIIGLANLPRYVLQR